MNKNVLVLGGAVLALVIFQKPISDMLNSIVPGGFVTDDDYFSPRDTSRGQVGAYDPPNIFDPDPSEPKPEPDYAPEPPPKPVSAGDEETTTDTKGYETVSLSDDTKEQSLIDYLKTPEGALSGAFVGAMAAPALYRGAKKLIPKALEKGKNVIPKVVEKSSALKELGKKAIKSPLLRRAGLTGLVVVGTKELLQTGIKINTDYLASPKKDFSTGYDAPRKYISAQTLSQTRTNLNPKPVSVTQNDYSPKAAWRQAGGFGTTDGKSTYHGVNISNLTPQNLSPVIAKAIREAKQEKK